MQHRGQGMSVRLKHDNIVRMRRRVKDLQLRFAAGLSTPQEVRSQGNASLAHARHGQTRALVRAELSRLSFIYCGEDEK